MKKISIIIGVLLFFIFSPNQTLAGSCDQVFNGTLRYGQGYSFGDTFSNTGSKEIRLSNRRITFSPQYDYNGAAANPGFSWTSNIVGKSYKVMPGKTEAIIQSSPSYALNYYPPTRSSNNLVVKYEIQYYTNNNGTYVGPTTHTECKYYTITRCGDGVKDNGYEQCDDGNDVNGDGCSSTCQIEPKTTCGDGTVQFPNDDGQYETCDDGNTMNGDGCSSVCIVEPDPTFCGDGEIQFPNDDGEYETCDDGNTVNGDGCSSVCIVEPDPTFCGDGEIQFPNDDGQYETCDDGNTINGDGCSSVCIVEPDPTFCGDGEIQFPNDNGQYETCDDGNTMNGDGCSSVCLVEPDPTFCGDGEIQFPNDNGQYETCDDGNNINGDGCSSVCSTEVVTTFCGDGEIQFPNDDGVFETCDDGNNINGDGCSSVCSTEVVTTFCGDGIPQQPNDDGINEECDDGNNINGDGCSSVCTIEPFVPSISIDKVDGNPIDIDSTVGNDTQTIASGGLAIFKITITNDGTDDLQNLVVSDVMAANCGGSIPLPAVPATFMSWSLSGSGNHTDSIFQIGEVLEYYCDSDKSDEDYTNTIVVSADGINSGNSVNDSDTSDVVIQLPTPQIDIVKNDANPNDLDLDIGGNDSQTVNSGSGATFAITVTNVGTENLNTVVINDPLVAACSRTNVETVTLIQAIGNNDTIFDIGETFTYNCTDPVVTADYTNTVGVTAVGVDSGTSVNDSDTSNVVIFIPPAVPVCTGLSVSQSSGSSNYTSNYTCTGTGVTSYNVVLTDPSGNTQSFTTPTGSFNINTRGTYSASCFINGLTTTPLACTQTLIRGGGSSGGSTSCRSGTFTTNTATCIGSSRARYMRFTCENGVILEKSGNNATFTKNECNDNLTTGDIEANTMKFPGAKCYASRTGTSWTTRGACQYDPGGGGGPYCGDGVVQRPNRSGFMEECDSSAGCTSCKLDVVTRPTNVNIQIDRVNEHYIIGNTMDLYQTHTSLRGPTVRNLSDDYDDDYFIPEICVYVKSGNSLDGVLKCETVGMLYSPLVEGEKNSHYYGGPFVYKGNTTGLANGVTQDLNKVAYTLGEGSNNPVRGGYFEEIFDVTTVKPTITTTGGGSNFVKNENAADIKQVGNTTGHSDNSNYVGAGLGSNLSSSSKDNITSADAEIEGDDLVDIIDEKIEIDSSVTTTDWTKYNGMNNVFYFKGNTSINQTVIGSTGVAKTYIVEGNLSITSNLAYDNNIAFIVKNGNLIINQNVTSIKGTFIVLNGYVDGTGITDKQLVINGSIYGNMDKLLTERVYVKNNSSGQIDVGTIVSFGSSVFRKPAPLTTKFLNDYLEATKVAQ